MPQLLRVAIPSIAISFSTPMYVLLSVSLLVHVVVSAPAGIWEPACQIASLGFTSLRCSARSLTFKIDNVLSSSSHTIFRKSPFSLASLPLTSGATAKFIWSEQLYEFAGTRAVPVRFPSSNYRLTYECQR